MIRFGIGLFSLAGMLLWTSAGTAQVNVKAPFVRVETGGPFGGTYVKAPFVRISTPPQIPAYVQPPVVVEQPGLPQLPPPQPFMPPLDPSYVVPPQQPLILPGPSGSLLPQQPVLTHKEFAKIFVPLPGTYQVTLLHPGSRCPVDVCFTLPPGCPRVRVGHRYIEFDYGHCEVEIRFALFGKVRVIYD